MNAKATVFGLGVAMLVTAASLLFGPAGALAAVGLALLILTSSSQ